MTRKGIHSREEVSNADDKDLIDGVIGEDSAAQARFVDKFSNFILSILVRDFRLPREVAEDLHSETFLRLLDDNCRRLRHWSGDGNFVNYLGPIVRNLALDYLRKPEVRRIVDGETTELTEPISRVPGPEQLAEMAEKRRLVTELIEELSERDRELIGQRHFKGRSYREIAEAMGYEISSVGVLLARAEKRLKAALDQRLKPSPVE